MDRIDIKLFKAQNKYEIKEGKLNQIFDVLEGKEIEFINIPSDKMTKLNNYKDLSDFYMDLIPRTSNVDITINKEEFIEMLENQTIVFEDFLNAFTLNIKDIMVNKQKGITISQDINKFLKENGLDNESLNNIEEVKRHKEDIELEIKNLYETMKNDKDNRAAILEKINILEKELGEL